MKYAAFSALTLILATLACAQDAPADASDRLRELQRDLPLIEVLVQEGLHLAERDDPLQRAQSCNAVAERLVREVEQARGGRDRSRASQLGSYLEAILEHGVAGNLDIARTRLADDSQLGEIHRVRDEALRVTEPVSRTDSQSFDRQTMGPATEAINKGRKAVQDAAKGK